MDASEKGDHAKKDKLLVVIASSSKVLKALNELLVQYREQASGKCCPLNSIRSFISPEVSCLSRRPVILSL